MLDQNHRNWTTSKARTKARETRSSVTAIPERGFIFLALRLFTHILEMSERIGRYRLALFNTVIFRNGSRAQGVVEVPIATLVPLL